MDSMDGWSLALLVAGGYVAITALVRLMVRRRNQLMDQFREEVQREKGRRGAEGRRAKTSKAA
jgi:hypothetical protein